MTLSIFLLLVAGYSPLQLDQSTCWRDTGMKELYSSFQQVEDIQQLAKAQECEVLAITWQVKLLPERHNLMLWDSKRQEMVRVQLDATDVKWEVCATVSRGDILTRDPVDLCEYVKKQAGEGRAPLSDAARGLIRVNAGSIFGPVL
ncbi:MAG: hypothetical protein P8X82_09135 [Gemmatimonadales bacterium]